MRLRTIRPLLLPPALALALALTYASCTKGRDASDQSQTAAITFADGAAPPAGGAPEAAPRPAAPPTAYARSRTKDAANTPEGFTGSGAAALDVSVVASGPNALPSQVTETIAPSMIIRTGQASVEVSSLDTAVARIRAVASALGGYVANTSVQSGAQQVRSATLEIKVPSSRFDQAVTGLAAIGKVESVSVSAEDVGEEFVDITARVNNARRLEDRLIELLARRTGKLEEVLSVERELARIREEIERYEGRLRYLRSRSAVSTLSVTVHEPSPILGPPHGQNVIVEAFKDAWRHFVGLVAGLIESLGVLIPLLLIVGGAWVAFRRWRPLVVTRDVPAPKTRTEGEERERETTAR